MRRWSLPGKNQLDFICLVFFRVITGEAQIFASLLILCILAAGNGVFLLKTALLMAPANPL
jgi:hypothetical protein